MSRILHTDVRTLHRQILSILAVCLVVMGVLWLFVLNPLREERDACASEILNVEEELTAFQVRMEDGGLADRLASATARNRQLVAEWDALRKRVNTFQSHKEIRESLPASDDGRIDFKVALFDAREELLQRAAQSHVSLPEDLGVSETIGSEERAELRLWHLVATVRLVQLAIDAHLPVIAHIDSGEPMALSLDDNKAEMAMEFPTRLVVRCSFKHLVRFLDMLSQEGSFYAIRKLRVERMDTHGSEMLEAELVAGAILFHVRAAATDVDEAGEGEPPVEEEAVTARGRRARIAQHRRELPYDG